MTDDELVELVLQASPDELSDEVLELIEERLRRSAALRQAVRQRVTMDQYLAGILGQSELTAEQLVERARREAAGATPSNRHMGWWGAGLVVLLAALAFGARQLGWWPGAETAVALPGEDPAGGNADPVPPEEGDPNNLDPGAKVPDAPPDDPGIGPHDDSTDGQEVILWEAERFDDGNVEVDRFRYGRGIGVIRGVRRQAHYVEYELPIPKPGSYRLSLRYAAGEPRPLKVTLHGTVIAKEAANREGTGWSTRDQSWEEIGVADLPAGSVKLRLETEQWEEWSSFYFPHVDKLKLERQLDAAELALLAQKRRPWEGPDHLGGPPRKLAELASDNVALRLPPRRRDLGLWFTTAANHAQRFQEEQRYDRPLSVFQGWLKLRPAWPRDAVLRLAFAEPRSLRLYCYRGREGVALHYYEDRQGTWAAYRCTRDGVDPQPKTLVLAATDEGRNQRTSPASVSRQGFAPLDLYWRAGELVVLRGDVRLLTAPLAEPPEDVYLYGDCGIAGLGMVRVADLPAPPTPRPAGVVLDRPADQKWFNLPTAGGQLERLADGRVTLTTDVLKTSLWTAFPLPPTGLREVVVQIDAPSAGAGVYLSDDAGQPREMVRFVRDRRTTRLAAVWGGGDQTSDYDVDPSSKLAPFVGEQVWLKFLVGCGLLRCSLSSDGVHWSRPFEAQSNWQGPASTLGLFAKSGQSKRSITLRRVELRELTGLTQLVPADLRQQAPRVTEPVDLPKWQARVDAARPANVDPATWRRAAAVRTLASSAPATLTMPLLLNLVDELPAAKLTWEQRLAALEDAMLLANVWDDHAAGVALATRYRQWGEAAWHAGADVPYATWRRASLETPLWSRHPVLPNLANVARLHLLDAVAGDRWEQVDALGREVRFWQFRSGRDDRSLDLVDWALTIARRHLPRQPNQPMMPLRPEWLPLYEEQLNKRTFNLMAEFHAALAGQQFRDAAGVISSMSEDFIGSELAGLLPDASQPDLFVSLAVAVQLAIAEHPPLAAAMNEHFGPIAQQRVQRAISEGNVAALQAATLQFHGTPAAAAAHAWLGDRALVVGEFARALAHYEQAVAYAGMADRELLAARARFAAALLGRDFGAPAAGEVTLGETKLTAAEFEQLVAQARQQATQVMGGPVGSANPSAPQPTLGRSLADRVPRPGNYTLTKLADFAAKRLAWRDVTDNDEPMNIDWSARQIAWCVDRDLVLVGSRYALAAYDRSTGKLKWSAGDAPGNDRRPSAVYPFRPLVVGPRVYRRSPALFGATIVAHDRATGNVAWRTRLPSGATIASDPQWMSGELVALLAEEDDRQTATALSLVTLDPDSGELRREQPLARVARPWWDLTIGQTTVVEDTLVATLGGMTLCCDSAGQVRWVRREHRVPAGVDNWTVLQAVDPPQVVAGRLVVAQPAVRALDGLDPGSGRRLWRVALPDLMQFVGPAADLAIVRTRRHLLAVSPTDGKIAWRVELSPDDKVVACGTPDQILVARRPRGSEATRLFWYAAATGQLAGQGTVTEPDVYHIGQLLAITPDQFWLLARGPAQDETRSLCRLAPKK